MGNQSQQLLANVSIFRRKYFCNNNGIIISNKVSMFFIISNILQLQQIIGSHQMGQSPPPVLDHLPSNGQSQIFQTNTSALTTVVSNSTQNHPHPAPK